VQFSYIIELQQSAAIPSFFSSSIRCYQFTKGAGIVMGYGLDGPGSIPGCARFFSSQQRPDGFWGPTSLLSDGYGGIFSQGLSGRDGEADHSPTYTAEVKKGGAIPPLSHMSS
jgi:hypothetical protein